MPAKVDPSRIKRIPASDSWVAAVSEFALSDSGGAREVREALSAKKNTVKNSGASYRVINHWAESGLIDDTSRDSSEGWRRLSFLDLVWIQVVMELRKYGVPLNSLKIARDAIFEVPGKPDKVMPEFSYAVANCVAGRKRRFLVVYFSDGWAEVAEEDEFERALHANLLSQKSYLVVDLNECCRVISPNTPMPEFRVNVALSDEEIAVLESVRSGEYDVVEVHGVDGKVSRIRCRKRMSAVAGQLDELVRRIKFGDFTVKVQNGIAVVTEVNESKRV